MQKGNMIEFKNGSEIKCISTNNNVRSKRSELMGFYCTACDNIHEDYPIKNIRWIDDNMVCKETYKILGGSNMNYLNKYMHEEKWIRRGEHFCIEVIRWEIKELETIEYIWNVYCYIYPGHKLFDRLLEEDISDGRIIKSFHKGCTYCMWYRAAKGNVLSKQYGSDYSHYGDDEFLRIKNPEDAYEVFIDADKLFKELSVK